MGAIEPTAVLAVLDAVEDRLSLCALRFHRALEAETEEERRRRLLEAKAAIGRANRLLAAQMAFLRKGLWEARPPLPARRSSRCWPKRPKDARLRGDSAAPHRERHD